jgi:hypothetical protein
MKTNQTKMNQKDKSQHPNQQRSAGMTNLCKKMHGHAKLAPTGPGPVCVGCGYERQIEKVESQKDESARQIKKINQKDKSTKQTGKMNKSLKDKSKDNSKDELRVISLFLAAG